jgi:hypothetical protein
MPTTTGLLLDPNILSEDDLLALYNKAFQLLLAGKTVMEFEGEGTKFKYDFPIPVATMLSETRYALRQKNPAVYGHNCTQIKPYFV